MKDNLSLQISDQVKQLAIQAQRDVTPYFQRIEEISEENTRKVLSAFQKHRVADGYFAGTTGYGYDDIGRDKLDAIYADIFRAEDALVRIQFVNGLTPLPAHCSVCSVPGMCWFPQWAPPMTHCWV